MDTEDLIEKKVKIMILLYIMIIMLAMLPCMINQVIKICSYKQTTSLNVDDKYYQNYHWGNSYKIVIDCYDEEKEIAVSEKEFHVIKIGDNSKKWNDPDYYEENFVNIIYDKLTEGMDCKI